MTAERCRYFRSKTMFVTGQREPDYDEEESGASGYCWCNQTMTEIGSDNRLVSLGDCSNASRTCYRLE